MTKRKGAQQDSAKDDTAAESPAEQTAEVSTPDEDTKEAEGQGDSDESPKPERKLTNTGRDLYPEGASLFEYQPIGSTKPAEKIYFPKEFDKPDKVWLWELNQLPFLNQSWAWMDKAGVPKPIQRQVVSLGDDEYSDVFAKWFESMGGGATPGE